MKELLCACYYMLKDTFLACREHGFKQRTQIGKQMTLHGGLNAFTGKMQSYSEVFPYVKTCANEQHRITLRVLLIQVHVTIDV